MPFVFFKASVCPTLSHLEHSPEPCVVLSGWVIHRAAGFLTLLTCRAFHQSEQYSSASHFHYWLVGESSAPVGHHANSIYLRDVSFRGKNTTSKLHVPYL